MFWKFSLNSMCALAGGVGVLVFLKNVEMNYL